MQQAARAVRRSRWIAAPLIVVVLIAVAWSAFWYVASRRVETEMTAWMQREAQAGRVYSCATTELGGYPFRIELRCGNPQAALSGPGAPLVFKASTLVAVAQVYGPDLIVAELSGPLQVSGGVPAVAYAAEWTLLQASLRGWPWALERLSLVADGASLRDTAASEPATLLQAKRVEWHLRQAPAAPPADPALDLAVEATGAVIGAVPVLAGRPLDAAATAVVQKAGGFSTRSWPDWVRAWQAAGGRVVLTKARMQQGEAVAAAGGELGVTAQGRIDGALQVTLAGLDELAGALMGGRQNRLQAGLMAGLRILGGGVQLEGKPAINVPLQFRDGAVFAGPLQIGRLPPLF